VTPEQPQADPQYLRRARPLNEALPTTVRWVAQLAPSIRLHSLLREFPRIVNVLARLWPDAASFAAYLDSLLHDRRGGRRGFPPEVQHDLLMLRDFFEDRYGPRARHTRGPRW
jgi:hypothetical protein